MTRDLPLYRHEPPRTRTTRVEWLPATGQKGSPVISIGDSTVRATPIFGLDLKVGDEVIVTRVGQTMRIDAIVSRPTPPTTTTTTTTP